MIPVSYFDFDSLYADYFCYKMRKNKITEIYINISMSFDIETTSTYKKDGTKIAFPYLFQFGINHKAYYCRTMEECVSFFTNLSNHLKYKIVCLVHNLSYEFTFMSGFLPFTDVFCREPNKPMKCRYGNIVFYDSYLMSGYSLENLAKNFCKTQKLKEIMDYSIIRYPNSDLDSDVLRYAENDVIILNEYWDVIAAEFIKRNRVCKIPITKTSRARFEVRKHIKNQKMVFDALTKIKSSDYIMDKMYRSFAGAIVKSNRYYTGYEIKSGVDSLDETSAYPFVMFVERFPMTRYVKTHEKRIEEFDKDYSYLMTVQLINVRSKNGFSILSFSKCKHIYNYTLDNGRVLDADVIELECNDIDLVNLKRFYDFKYRITEIHKSKLDYLPKYLVNAIVSVYEQKQKIKEELEETIAKYGELHEKSLFVKSKYLNIKGVLNAFYGMCVMKVMDFEYEWNGKEFVAKKIKDKYKVKFSDFLAFQWGLLVTSYSRKRLCDGVLTGTDTIYSDTDSVKKFHSEENLRLFNELNAKIRKEVKEVCELRGYDFEIMKGIGEWDLETSEPIKHFKTLGSKRYCCNDVVTISGISKKKFKEYADIVGERPIDLMKDGLEIPKEFTGKTTMTYFTNQPRQIYTYYLNNKEYSIPVVNYIHASEQPFSISIDRTYKRLLLQNNNIY